MRFMDKIYLPELGYTAGIMNALVDVYKADGDSYRQFVKENLIEAMTRDAIELYEHEEVSSSDKDNKHEDIRSDVLGEIIVAGLFLSEQLGIDYSSYHFPEHEPLWKVLGVADLREKSGRLYQKFNVLYQEKYKEWSDEMQRLRRRPVLAQYLQGYLEGFMSERLIVITTYKRLVMEERSLHSNQASFQIIEGLFAALLQIYQITMEMVNV